MDAVTVAIIWELRPLRRLRCEDVASGIVVDVLSDTGVVDAAVQQSRRT